MGLACVAKIWPFLQLRKKKAAKASCEYGIAADGALDIIQVAPSPRASPSITDDQAGSLFLQKLPLEIRRLIYQQVWQNTKTDKHYYQPNGRHLSFERGRWHSRRCVMVPADEDLDFIQEAIDTAYNATKLEQVREGHSWLRSSWGHRHWRCERRMWRPATRIDRTDFSSLLIACKRMYPEVVQSIFESHKFMLNDIYSAHEFLVESPPPFSIHMRELDLTLIMGQHHYRPFIPATSESADHSSVQRRMPNSNWVSEIWAVLDKKPCLHSLRISLDVHDRGVWRKIPEKNITSALRQLRVLHDFVIELPPNVPFLAPSLQGQTLDENNDCQGPFRVTRRPALRYWNFVSDKIERFQWEADTSTENGDESCSVAILKDNTFVHSPQAPYNNPHLV